ncbi:Cell shape-determining protein MreB [Streptomyces violaceorubidus]
MAAAIGSGLPVHEATGNMVVDIGGGTTEVAVISLGGIVTAQSIRVEHQLDNAIIQHVKKEYSLLLGERTADRSITIGSAYDLDADEHTEIRGRDLVSGLPKTVVISAAEVRKAIEGRPTRVNRILLSVALVVVALVIQVSVLARLHLPGAVPDLLLLTVLGLALVYGHVGGALVGFGAGLLADLAPPADHAAGRYALVLCVIGYLAGLARPDNGRLRSATGPMVVVAAAAIGTTLLYAGVGALVGDTAARHVGLPSLLSRPPCTTCCSRPSSSPASWRSPGVPSTTRWPTPTPPPRARDISSGWLSGGTGLRIGRQRNALRVKTARARVARAGRIKGVKRL